MSILFEKFDLFTLIYSANNPDFTAAGVGKGGCLGPAVCTLKYGIRTLVYITLHMGLQMWANGEFGSRHGLVARDFSIYVTSVT